MVALEMAKKNFFERFVAFQEEIKFFLIRRQKKNPA